MNLIHTPFIDVRRRNGEVDCIKPAEITSQIDTNPIVELISVRPDFQLALHQLLIGLLQSSCDSVVDQRDWKDLWKRPPSEATLLSWFEPIAHAFELDGGGPRFMQDASVADAAANRLSGLLIDAPGDNALKNNTDHFIKRQTQDQQSLASAAIALFCLQTNAPSGGQGHRTGLRGGGPLTTLVVPPADRDPTTGELREAPLWQQLWINVLPRREFLTLGNADKTADADRFPWLAPTRLSDKSGQDTSLMDVHPDQYYWAMPRRIWLNISEQQGHCSLTGQAVDVLVTGYRSKNFGVNYTGSWQHPLSPHSLSKDGILLPAHPQPGGIAYRHWPKLALAQGEGEQIAAVIAAFYQRGTPGLRNAGCRIWSAGFDMDNMKARSWHSSLMPLFNLSAQQTKELWARVNVLIEAALLANVYLRGAIKDAWFGEKSNVSGDLSYINQSFFTATETVFFAHLDALRELLLTDGDTFIAEKQVYAHWHRDLRCYCMEYFDAQLTNAGIEHSNPRRVSDANKQLRNKLNGKTIKGLLLMEVKAKSKRSVKKEASHAA